MPNAIDSINESQQQCLSNLNAETDLVGRFQADVERAGLVGERQNAAIVLLVALSARLDNPLNLTVCGESSAGKNHLLGTVAKFIPEDMQKFMTGMTAKTLMHAGETEFQHKAIFIAEYEGVSKADYGIRTFQSERVIEWDFVESSKNGIVKKNKIVRGPAAFLQATTRAVLHPENETRLLFVTLDESPEQTRAIMYRQAREAAIGETYSAHRTLEQWREFIGSLQLTKVRIPYAELLSSHFPGAIRSRRDFPKILELIRVSAFLHQNVREKEGETIIANADDYRTAKTLFAHCYEMSPDKAVEQLVRVAEELGQFRVADLMQKTHWQKTKTYELVKRAEEQGCIAETETRGQYKFVRGSSALPLELPEAV